MVHEKQLIHCKYRQESLTILNLILNILEAMHNSIVIWDSKKKWI
jgi:hypothetical protein